jgi:putative endopeptidase
VSAGTVAIVAPRRTASRGRRHRAGRHRAGGIGGTAPGRRHRAAANPDAGGRAHRRADAYASPVTALPHSGIDLTGRDPQVRPQDDFYRACHGRWLEDFEIPPDKAEYASFTKLHDEAQDQLKAIIESLAESRPPETTPAGKIATIYADFLDVEARNERGLVPLGAGMARVSGLQDPADMAYLFGGWDRAGVGSPLGTYVHQDNMDSSRYLLDVRQSGLGLPDRDYYLEERHAQTLADYREHVATMWRLTGLPGDPDETAARIVALETKIAAIHWDKVRNRDPHATYNLLSVGEASASAPGLSFGQFLAGAHASERATQVNFGQPDYFVGLGVLMTQEPLTDWQDYLRFHLVSAFAPLLTEPLDAAHFAFYGTKLRGVPQQRPMWKRGVDLVQGSMSEALGQEYVARHFPPEHKDRMLELVGNLLAEYGSSIDALPWMSEATKAQARAKLATFRAKIGYPDRWRDYSGLRIVPGDVVGNTVRAARFEHDFQLAKLGGPIDRDEWFMPPQMVNAYYNPEMNEIVFPAAILQPPFFDMSADDAVNYGAIGAVIGHEISHGFDDKGCQYDGEGNLRNWWTEEDHAAFEQRTKALVQQYEQYEPVPGHRLNGELTLGENIADVSGVAVAFRAYLRSLDGAQAPVIDGYTGAQRFFLGYSQVWRAKTRPEEAIRRVATDPHSPPEFRVLGVLVNNDDFAAAFDVQPGDGMWRDLQERVRIW